MMHGLYNIKWNNKNISKNNVRKRNSFVLLIMLTGLWAMDDIPKRMTHITCHSKTFSVLQYALYDLHSSPNIIWEWKREEWDEFGMGRIWGKCGCRDFVGKPEGQRVLGRHIHIWEDNIKIDLKAVGMDRIDLAQDRDRWRALVNVVVNLLIPQNVDIFLTNWGAVSLSRTVFHGANRLLVSWRKEI